MSASVQSCPACGAPLETPVACGACARRTGFAFAEVAAPGAVANAFDCRRQGLGQARAALALALQHVVGHPLCGLLADAGEDAEGFYQLFEEG